MTKLLKFTGYSDDTFGEERIEDYDNCASGEPIVFRVAAGTASMLVWGQYAPNEARGGCGWVVGVSNEEGADGDETPLPPWPMTLIQGDCPYSPTLQIEAPDGVTIMRVFPPIEGPDQ